MSKRRGNFLLLGALIGFIAGLFFAPKKGSELRRDAKNKIDEIKENPKDVLQGTFDDVKARLGVGKQCIKCKDLISLLIESYVEDLEEE